MLPPADDTCVSAPALTLPFAQSQSHRGSRFPSPVTHAHLLDLPTLPTHPQPRTSTSTCDLLRRPPSTILHQQQQTKMRLQASRFFRSYYSSSPVAGGTGRLASDCARLVNQAVNHLHGAQTTLHQTTTTGSLLGQLEKAKLADRTKQVVWLAKYSYEESKKEKSTVGSPSMAATKAFRSPILSIWPAMWYSRDYCLGEVCS
ncbi:hypothetical protein IQ07DRAFT_333907 [Pyrenochaeta sp. DS3sAY3a]|nr:hypothetical protein IQ07DRAFT_333907 [Pyrenochaeta sp. DS3sAY3a]